MTGREISAEEALKLGLVSRVVPAEELMKTAEEYAGMILKNSQRAVRSVKETIINIQGCSFDDALRLEAINGYSCLGDFSEAEERLKAFIKKQ
jgi:enoyl-CoA hydratase